MLDPVADLKLHQLDLVEAIHERQALMQVRRAPKVMWQHT